MKKLWLLLFFVSASFNPLAAQQVEHAPSIEQCRADMRLWLSEVEDENQRLRLSYLELSNRADEMSQCRSVDPEFYFKYYNTSAENAHTRLVRFIHFLDRHGLIKQFLAADEQGQR
jgi:hypothetical protein